jgi:hypothetical protein
LHFLLMVLAGVFFTLASLHRPMAPQPKLRQKIYELTVDNRRYHKRAPSIRLFHVNECIAIYHQPPWFRLSPVHVSNSSGLYRGTRRRSGRVRHATSLRSSLIGHGTRMSGVSGTDLDSFCKRTTTSIQTVSPCWTSFPMRLQHRLRMDSTAASTLFLLGLRPSMSDIAIYRQLTQV